MGKEKKNIPQITIKRRYVLDSIGLYWYVCQSQMGKWVLYCFTYIMLNYIIVLKPDRLNPMGAAGSLLIQHSPLHGRGHLMQSRHAAFTLGIGNEVVAVHIKQQVRTSSSP